MKPKKTETARVVGPVDPLTGARSFETIFYSDGTTKRVSTARGSKKRARSPTPPDSPTSATASTPAPPSSIALAPAVAPPPTPQVIETEPTTTEHVFARDNRFLVRRLACSNGTPSLLDSTQLFLVSNAPVSNESSSTTWAAIEIFVVHLQDDTLAVTSRCSSCPTHSFLQTALSAQYSAVRHLSGQLPYCWCEHSMQAAAAIHHGLFARQLGINMGTCEAIASHCTVSVQLSPFSLAFLPPNSSFTGGAYLTLDDTISFKYIGGRAVCAGCSRNVCIHQAILREAQSEIGAAVVAQSSQVSLQADSVAGGTQAPLDPADGYDLEGAFGDYLDDSYLCLNGGSLNSESSSSSVLVDQLEKDWTKYDHEVLSTTHYSLCPAGQHHISKCSIDRDRVYSQRRPRQFVPEGIDMERPPQCSQCQSAMVARFNYGCGWIVTRFHLFTEISIGHVVCTNGDCGHSVNYDGYANGLVNHANYLLIDAQLLLQAAKMWKSGTAIKLWWESLCSGYQGLFFAGEWKSLETKLAHMRGRLTKAIIGFLTICDYPQLEWCNCPSIDRVCVDGLVASCETRRMPKFNRPYFNSDSQFPKSFDRAHRSMWSLNGVTIPKSLRNTLKSQLALGVTISSSILVAYLKHPGIQLLWYFLETDDGGATLHLPKRFGAAVDLALALGKDVSPAIQMLPARVWPAVQRFLDGGDPLDDFASAPLLARLINLVNFIPVTCEDGIVPEEWKERVKDQMSALKVFVRSVFSVAMETVRVDPTRPSVKIDDIRVEATAMDELLAYGDYFPRHPVIRRIPTVLPEAKSKGNSGESDVCTKEAKGTTRLGAGVFLWWCLDCSNSVGFSVLDSAESPHHAFATLRTRFERPPSILVYDNACNLSEYCLNRDPEFFSDTLFLVDALHFSNHVNCSPIFWVKQYQSMAGVSSVMHEQKNSVLCRLKDLAPLMSYQTLAYLLVFAVTFA